MYVLSADEYQGVKELFKRLCEDQPMCAAVLEGIHSGVVCCDKFPEPSTAYLQTCLGSENEAQWGFLAGEPHREQFMLDLNRSLFDRRLVRESVPLVFFTCDAHDWTGALEQVFDPYPLTTVPRRHYVCRGFNRDWKEEIPRGFSIERMDGELLRRKNLEIPEEVQLILKKWSRVWEPRFSDYGFVAIDDLSTPVKVAAWATVDFVVNGVGDLGMFTSNEYRKRGLAYLTSAACLAHGMAGGIGQIFWTCMEENSGSIATAEKLGLERGADYTMYLLIFDPIEHRATRAYYQMASGEYQQAADTLEDIISANSNFPEWVLIDAAHAWAALGEGEKALVHLNSLAVRGEKDLGSFEKDPAFASLHDLPGWQSFIARIKENARQ